MVGSSEQRSEVWRGLRKKTSGGLVKADLIKNKRGKIVSKRKSSQASDQNNLGTWLRSAGKSVPKDKMLRKKGKSPDSEEPPKPQAKPASNPPKAKPAKAKPAKTKPAKAKPKAKPARKPAGKPKKVDSGSRRAAKQVINPLTGQVRSKKSGMGFVSGGNVSLDNVVKRRLRPRKKVSYAF